LKVENPLLRIIDEQGFLVLDGGLATTLEARGNDLNDELWSARLLLENPDAIRQVHRDFLDAGADCIITASYQATLEGFARRGLNADEGEALIRASVDLALESRQNFLDENSDSAMRPRPLVAASVGPYGAFLADGSEFAGQYDLDDAGLLQFHRERWRILADTPADLLACETIPSLREASVLLSLLADTPGRWAWFSFSCRDGRHLNDGNPYTDAVRLCSRAPQVAAVGVNCTQPRYVASLIAEARRVSNLPLIAYPNLGGKYNAATKTWHTRSSSTGFAQYVRSWLDAGAQGIGGCCRVGPREIEETRRVLAASS
jgi:homocysteine S-methyltransferase